MYFAVAFLYLMICSPVVLRICIGINGTENSIQMEIAYLGICLRFDGRPVWNPLRRGFGAVSRYKRKAPGREVRRGKRSVWFARRILASSAYSSRIHRADLAIRLGLGDAAMTAVAAGACRAAVAAAAAVVPYVSVQNLSICADFGKPCFLLCFSSIFSVSAGDIMFAALKAVLNKGKGDDSAWKSIPLKV